MGRLKTRDLTSWDHRNCRGWHRETGQNGTISQGWTSRDLQCPPLRYGAALSGLAMSGLAISAPPAGSYFVHRCKRRPRTAAKLHRWCRRQRRLPLRNSLTSCFPSGDAIVGRSTPTLSTDRLTYSDETHYPANSWPSFVGYISPAWNKDTWDEMAGFVFTVRTVFASTFRGGLQRVMSLACLKSGRRKFLLLIRNGYPTS